MFMRDVAKRIVKTVFGDNQRVREILRKLDGWFGSMSRPHAPAIASGLDETLDFGVNVAGFFGGDFGVAVAARADVKALTAAGVPFVINSIESSPDRDGHSPGMGHSKDNPYKVNLVHVNAEQSYEFFRKAGPGYFAGRYNIGYWVWELPRFPDSFAGGFGYFDEIWTPSTYSMDAISKLSPVPVVRMPHAIDPKEMDVPPDRERFGIKKGEFCFLFMFDFYSVYERKNPAAVIEAFKRAFSGDGNVRLVIKHSNSGRFGTDLEKFNRHAGRAGDNVTIIDGRLSRREICSLMSSCDCYISLHRAEGFGLTVAEAMAMGKPVIATAYSGNTDFMDLNNSFPVRYDLTVLDRDLPPYEKGMVWAEPDVGHAADLMRLVYEDEGVRKRIGEKAREDVLRTLSPEAVGMLYKQRLGRVLGEGGCSEGRGALRR